MKKSYPVYKKNRAIYHKITFVFLFYWSPDSRHSCSILYTTRYNRKVSSKFISYSRILSFEIRFLAWKLFNRFSLWSWSSRHTSAWKFHMDQFKLQFEISKVFFWLKGVILFLMISDHGQTGPRNKRSLFIFLILCLDVNLKNMKFCLYVLRSNREGIKKGGKKWFFYFLTRLSIMQC